MEAYEMNGTEDNQPLPNGDHGWQKVTYLKKQKKQKAVGPRVNPSESEEENNVFRSLEKRSEERRRRILETQRAEERDDVAPTKSRRRYQVEDRSEDEVSDDSAAGSEKETETMEEKKVKVKKPKKPKVSVAEAAAKIDESDLASFLADITGSYDGQQDIQLMRFADYFGKRFSAVSSAQFPWIKLFRESPVSKLADVPLSHISDGVYKTSIEWINHLSVDALSSFIIWCLDSILADLVAQHPPSKHSKKITHASAKSQVAMFVVLAMVLRRKPDALLNILSTFRENSKYQGQDKLPLHAWMTVQASQGDLAVGMYVWAHNLLPLVSGKNCNPQSRDIVLQVVERLLSTPKARTILVNGAVRKGERLIPPLAFESLLRLTFPSHSSRVKATERFEAAYPTLKEVALAGSSGSKAMKQAANQIFPFAVKAAGEETPELSSEATGIAIWCLSENAECFAQWEKMHSDNEKASVIILKRVSDNWKELSTKLAGEPLRRCVASFKEKNGGGDAEKYCKMVLKKLDGGNAYLKGFAFLAIAVAVGVATVNVDFDSLYASIAS